MVFPRLPQREGEETSVCVLKQVYHLIFHLKPLTLVGNSLAAASIMFF